MEIASFYLLFFFPFYFLLFDTGGWFVGDGAVIVIVIDL